MNILKTEKTCNLKLSEKGSQLFAPIACLTIALTFLLPLKSPCQNYPFHIEGIYKKNQVSMPEMAALARNISYPVDYVTGTVNIKIPLYEVQCGSLSLPIYLSYNTGGIKVSDPSGWVGQGWTLYSVPIITRSPQGKTDRQLTCPVSNDNTNWHAYQVLTSESLDEEPDEYYYQLADKGGMFLYAQESEKPGVQFLSMPYEDVRVGLVQDHFFLTDDKGVKYFFNGGTDITTPSDGNLVSCWRASYMASADGLDSLWFQYDNHTANTIEHHEDHITIVDQFSNEYSQAKYHHIYELNALGLDDEEGLCSPVVYTTFDNATQSYQVSPSGALYSDGRSISDIAFHKTATVNSYQVSNIHFSGGTVQFEVDDSLATKPLKTIKVKDTEGNIVKIVTFKYQSVNYRLYLNELEIAGNCGQSVERYQFQYEQPSSFPRPGQRPTDFWGYYNNVWRNDSETSVPRMNVPVQTNMNDPTCYRAETLAIGSLYQRRADENYMKYGSLKSITYPSGATDEFTYEANRIRLSYVDSPDAEFHFTQQLIGEDGIYQVGGLRIKQIKTLQDGNYVNIRTFTYGTDEDGTGHAPITEHGSYFTREQTKSYVDPSLNAERTTARYRVFSSSPATPVTYSKGAPVMYDTVTEYNGTPGQNKGKTVYHFSVPSTAIYANTRFLDGHLSSKYSDWQYGHLTDKTIYSYDGNSQMPYKPVSKTTYHYDFMGKFLGNVKSCYYVTTTTSNYPIPQQNIGFDAYRSSRIYPVLAKLLTSETLTQYFGQQSTEATTSYTYGNPQELTMTSKSVTRGNVTQTEEYTHPCQLRNTAPYNNMYDKNILAPTIATTYTYGNKYLKVNTPYIEQTSNQHTFYRPSSLWLQYTENGSPEQRLTYTYDSRGNLVQTIKDEREKETYLYSYNSQYPVAEIQNATYSTVCQQLGTSFVNSLATSPVMSDSQWTTLNNLRTLLPNAFVTTYRMKPLTGVKSIIDPAGHESFFDYDNFGRLMGKGLIHNNSRELLEKYTYHYKTEEP